MKRYIVTTLTFALTALVFFVYPQQFSDSGRAVGQKRGSRRVGAPQAARKAPIDYSKFSHATKKHQQACNTCHKVPTSNWRKVRDYPDISDYPGHGSCVSCHRPQFFKGVKPAICSACHSRVSPKDDARFAFRNTVGQRQFMIEFPHDKHQDVIAKLFRRFPVEAGSPAGQPGWGAMRAGVAMGQPRWGAKERPRFVRASFTSSNFNADDKAKHYNNCEICHGPRTAPSVAPASGWIDGFVPDNLTSKSVPVSHAACFSCHWKSEQPVNDNCAGCHKLPTPPAMLAVADSGKRISMKFRHGREQHIAECTTCHINITKAATLRGLKPDVPITSCTECHNKEGLRLDVSKELAAIDKNRDFVCVYCHTSDVGRLDPPAGHYLIAERPAVKRKDVK